MAEHFHDIYALFRHKLAVALAMEHDSLSMLHQLEQAAREEAPKMIFRDHERETRQQIDNLERCFELIGEKPHRASCGATAALASEASSILRRTDDILFDTVALSSAQEAERFEMGVYEGLIISADASGAMSVSTLLRRNLAQEESAADKIRVTAERVARAEAEVAQRKHPKGAAAQEPDPWS